MEAIDWYNQRVHVCKDKKLKPILAHSRYLRAIPVGIYPASKASVEGEATIICGGPCGAVAPPMPPHPALAPAEPDARFGFADGGGDASPWNRDEEKEHASMILEWIRRKDSSFSKELKDHLFTESHIAHE